MDLQEKLNDIDKELNALTAQALVNTIRCNELKKAKKGYLKLIEKAKALEK